MGGRAGLAKTTLDGKSGPHRGIYAVCGAEEMDTASCAIEAQSDDLNDRTYTGGLWFKRFVIRTFQNKWRIVGSHWRKTMPRDIGRVIRDRARSWVTISD